MKITKGPPKRAHAGKKAGGVEANKAPSKQTAKTVTAPPPKKDPASVTDEIERALLEEVAGTHASSQKLRTIVERVLGGGEDSDVRALVQKLAKAARTQT